jgi:phosphonopyruvate decarboxylase
MVDTKTFFEELCKSGIDFFTGVPDSLLKSFSAYVFDHADPTNHVLAANEGAAIALASGTYLGTGHPALVYLQNSGIGNAINPLLSLADPEVYSIPMVLMIGWRGMPGVKDEPQHIKQGRVQNKLIDSMELPYSVIGPDTKDTAAVTQELIDRAMKRSGPVALIIKKGTFSPYAMKSITEQRKNVTMKREQVLEKILTMLDDNDLVVSTTGITSREVFEIRARGNEGHHRDFLTVGSMGHCSQIALGLALKQPSRKVFCIDGDGAALMHMGSLSVIGKCAAKNFKHIVINNMAYESVGGQPTAATDVSIAAIAKASGYHDTASVSEERYLMAAIQKLADTAGPAMLEVYAKVDHREDLGRPTRSPIENRNEFMANSQGTLR